MGTAGGMLSTCQSKHRRNHRWAESTWGWCTGKWSEVAQSCPTLFDPMDCNLPGSIHGIFQVRILEWVAIAFSSVSSWPRDRTQVSRIAGRCFTIWATKEGKHLLKDFRRMPPWTFLGQETCLMQHEALLRRLLFIPCVSLSKFAAYLTEALT